jgi:hypothetical protein
VQNLGKAVRPRPQRLAPTARMSCMFVEHFDPERSHWVLGAPGVGGRHCWQTFAGADKSARAEEWLRDVYARGHVAWMLLDDAARSITGEVTIGPDDTIHSRFVAAVGEAPDAFLTASTPAPHALYHSHIGVVSVWRLDDPMPSGATGMLAGNYAARCRATSHPHCIPLPGDMTHVEMRGSFVRRPWHGRPELRPEQMPTGGAQLPALYQGGPVIDGTARHVETPFAWRAGEITAEAVDWRWPDVIEVGSMTLLSGQPKMGKSQIAQFIASIVSQGGMWPTGERAELGNVFVIDTEDTKATIAARMAASGANFSRVHIRGKGDPILDLSQRDGDMRKLAEFAASIGGLALLVISPGLTFFGPTSTDEVTVRAKLAPLLEWAAKTGCAVVFVLHPPKNAKASIEAQFAGCDTYRRAARGAWVVQYDPDDKNPNVKLQRRMLVCAGSNNGRDDLELRYRIVDAQTPDGVRTSKIKWLTDDEVYGGKRGDEDDAPVFDRSEMGDEYRAEVGAKRGDKINRAVDWLRQMISENGAMLSNLLYELAAREEPSIAATTLLDASKRLKIVKTNPTEDGRFKVGQAQLWSLPCQIGP